MKRFLYLTVALVVAAMSVTTVQANDYLEHEEHYTVMNMGNGVYRFTIPIWVYGRVNNYYLDSWNAHNNNWDSYIWYSLKPNQDRGSADVHRIATVAARRGGDNVNNDYKGSGEGFIYMHAGTAVIQNMKDGTRVTLEKDDDTYWNQWAKSLKLKRKNDDGHEDITYIEFDWYPPQELAGKDFYWGVSANIYKYSSGESTYTKWWKMSERLNVADPQTPELFKPYLYAMDDDGVTGYGNAAIQYVTYQSAVSYHTSLDSKETNTSDNSGTIIIPTTDSVQRQFNATFRVNMSNDPDKPQIFALKTNSVNVPAYHRIYDFKAEEILDAQKSVTGKVKLSWGIHFPGAEDLVDGDVFQVERALKADFSDAEQVSVQSFHKDSATYTFEDDPTSVLTDEKTSSAANGGYVSEKGVYAALDAEGNERVIYNVELASTRIYEPGKPVYYRVRRGSSAVWGWHEGFARTTVLTKNNYQAPLAQQQADYTKDANYDKNRLVHFQIHIENKAIQIQPEAENLCRLTYSVSQIKGKMPIRLTLSGRDGVNPANYTYKMYYLPPEGSLQQTMLPLTNNMLETEVEIGSKVQIHVMNSDGYSVSTLNLIGEMDDKAAYIASWELYPGSGQNLYGHLEEDEAAIHAVRDSLIAQHPLPDTARHTLYTKLSQKVVGFSSNSSRCNWDRNAILYLRRISVETNDTIEFPVPADSIKRQADGSWMAQMTNVADRSCTHYRYEVRVDQSSSVLKVLNPAELEPIQLNGPDLYYNDVAHISRFEASQGTDRYGIILTWESTPGGLDYYELSRREAGSTEEFKFVKQTEGNSYRDDSIAPGTVYEYQLKASFTCNNKTTIHCDTTTGFRSPYGLISGRIHYADGTGCPNVNVSLTSEGMNDLTTVTDESGRYAFDSLLYGEGKNYSIVPTSSYAEFRFNNTSMTTASIGLNAKNPVAEGIEFDNISAVRFSGRVLYSKSSIPVRDANIKLDTNMVYIAGGPLRTDASGNFELLVPKNHPFTLQVVKEGHTFEGNGFVRMNNDSNLVLDKALDGVRVWDATKVRLAGRIVGGKKQAMKLLGFGYSTNNLGDDLQLVLELEGDNISHIVRDENDLTRDTFEYTVPHEVHNLDDGSIDTIAYTKMHYQKKRIIINPDPATGEYCADLFPVRYKVTQATARGYATLFAEGKTSEVIDLSNVATHHSGDLDGDRATEWNEKYSITYRSPIDISCIQMKYGMEMPYYGELYMTRTDVLNKEVNIPLVERDSTGAIHYTFDHPVFASATYAFRITAHEDYYYNNDKTSPKHEEVRINGGQMKVYNGLHASEDTQTFSGLFPKWEQATQYNLGDNKSTDDEGQIDISIPVDYVSFNKTGEQSLRVLNVSVESDGRYIEKEVIKAYVTGNRSKGRDYMTQVTAGPVLLDVLRDPPGAKSYAYLESGTSFNYNYTFNLDVKFGVNLNFEYGTAKTMVFGTYLGTSPAIPAPYTGTVASASASVPYTIPITSGFHYKTGGSYTFTTNERIETGSDNWFVGSRGDVYIGTMQNVLLQMTDAVKPLDSLSYSTLAASLTENVGVTGKRTTVAEGRSLDSTKYYLAIGEEIAASSSVNGSFIYSQDYILTVVLPQLLKERNGLLVTGDSATVQAIADAKKEPVYWSHVIPTDTTYALANYTKVIPTGTEEKQWVNIDRVAEYNNTIVKWINLIKQNEKEKLNVLIGSDVDHVGNYSVSNGVKMSHSESYNATTSSVFYFKGLDLGGNVTSALGKMSTLTAKAGEQLAGQLANLSNLWAQPDGNPHPLVINTDMPGATTKFKFTPVLDIDMARNPDQSKSNTRTAGFVLEPDEYSYMNVDVFRRIEKDNHFNDSTADGRGMADAVGTDYKKNTHLYGSYVYRLNGGATKCPWEGPEESYFYTSGGNPIQMSAGTLQLENPTIDILNHEVSGVPHDQPAIIKIRLSNETQQTFESYVVFKLVLVDASNPNGAKVMMDGFPLTGDARAIKLNPGQTIDKTLEVYAGQGYDYENITLMLASQCDILNFTKASFSVHFQPTSCDVNISAPHDKWVMNTLSPKDSTGWYLPVVIDGYDIQHPNFDHIEFQYKLSTQSDDGWVNLCSFYADSTYYKEASGSKAMMKAGRIENIAFYGERDPMEQEYDLRAVSFCRYGTSYLTKASKVLTGIKDTRVPVVFGEPEPANSILGVGDHLKLRFNEPIAGNYLDEDNNFQITGITNSTGLSASTALHFDGNASAATKAKRDLTETDFTIDMMIKPTVANNRENDMILFETGDAQVNKQLILTKDNILRLVKTNGKNFLASSSKKLDDLRAFTRVVCVSEKTGRTRFFVGTEEVTSANLGSSTNTDEATERSAYFQFGTTYDGDMLEARVWTKALTLEEISATANRTLTGYERELLAYYRMDEGKGETVTDQAHGATLYLDGCSWNKQKGYSLKLDGEPVQLNGNLLGRSKIYDLTMMLWFKAEKGGTLFHSNDLQLNVPDGYADGNWHHMVLTVSRTYNNAALFLDGKMVQTYDATQVGGLVGTMYLGDNGFKGNIDEFVIFEQALPKSLVELYENNALTGDEMGLFAYLPFEEQYINPNGIIEQRFSINDRRTFKDANGNVVNKIVPLVMSNDQSPITNLADAANNAPIKSHGVLNKLYFNWAFNNDELMINILNRDYEVNKQSIYVTVRDVEDLNGNPMSSPVTWTAFVDRNSLKWSTKKLTIKIEDHADADLTTNVDIINTSGKRHTYTIESMPSWLSVSTPYGSLDPMEEKTVRLTFNSQIAVGEYSDMLYLTDEDGLSEPLTVEYVIEAIPPYDNLDEGKYPYNMSVCAKVEIAHDGVVSYDTDERDIVYAIYHNECVGQAHISFNAISNTTDVFLTVFGNDAMNRKPIRFLLWQASTGKTYGLTPNENVMFAHGYVYGCGNNEPLILSMNGSERQQIELQAGWNWVSTHLDLTATHGDVNTCMSAAKPWTEGDLIKNPNTRQFSTYNETNDVFIGTLTNLHHSQIYMVYAANANTMRVSGDILSEDSMKISVRGDGQWSPLPCLFDRRTSVTEALADYYQNASPGDMIKAHNRFATFSKDKRWVGDLTALQPGEGYLFRRMAPSSVEMKFFKPEMKVHSRKSIVESPSAFTNPQAATNMTMIAMINDGMSATASLNDVNDVLKVYVGDELAAVAEPIDSLYFLTIQSDQIGELRFEMNGQSLTPMTYDQSPITIGYSADSHHGSLLAPIVLKKDDNRPYKIIENQHVIIIRNNEKYDVTGKKL
jgi:hypothetical protein